MNLYTQCLSLCFLLVSLNPSIPMQAIFGSNPNGYGFDLSRFLKAVNIYYLLIFFFSLLFFKNENLIVIICLE